MLTWEANVTNSRTAVETCGAVEERRDGRAARWKSSAAEACSTVEERRFQRRVKRAKCNGL